MTGGQDVTGLMDVPSLTRSLAADGRLGHHGVQRRRPPLRARRELRPRCHGAAPRGRRRGAGGAAPPPRGLGADLRPALRGRGPPPAQAGRARRTTPARGHQPGRVRGLRRLLAGEQLPVGAARRDRVRRAARDPPVVLQQGLLVPRRRLPVLRDPGARRTSAGPADAPGAGRRRPRGGAAAAAGGGPADPDRPADRPTVQRLHDGHRRHRHRDRQPDRRPGRGDRGVRRAGRRPDRAVAEGRGGGLAPAPRARRRRRHDRHRRGRRRRPVPVGRHPAGGVGASPPEGGPRADERGGRHRLRPDGLDAADRRVRGPGRARRHAPRGGRTRAHPAGRHHRPGRGRLRGPPAGQRGPAGRGVPARRPAPAARRARAGDLRAGAGGGRRTSRR